MAVVKSVNAQQKNNDTPAIYDACVRMTTGIRVVMEAVLEISKLPIIGAVSCNFSGFPRGCETLADAMKSSYENALESIPELDEFERIKISDDKSSLVVFNIQMTNDKQFYISPLDFQDFIYERLEIGTKYDEECFRYTGGFHQTLRIAICGLEEAGLIKGYYDYDNDTSIRLDPESFRNVVGIETATLIKNTLDTLYNKKN